MTKEADVQDIIALERRRCEALTSSDIASLAELMSEDLIHVHGNGHMDGKAAYIEGVRTKYIFHQIERGDFKIRVYGDVAVVIGSLDQTVQVRGDEKRNEIKAAATQTWVRDKSGWKQNTCAMAFFSVASS